MIRRQPVQVTAWLDEPFAGAPPMLDGLLEWSMLRHMPAIKRTPHGRRHMGKTHHGYNVVPIPIGREPIGGWLIPLCSSPILPMPLTDCAVHYARPTITDDSLIAARRKINTSSGPNKSCLLPLRVRLVDRIVWFAVAEGESHGSGKVRNPIACLRRRLAVIHALGAKNSQGYGRVREWQVAPIDTDRSWFAPVTDGDVLMRPLPYGDWLPDPLLGAYLDYDRPCGPYHDKSEACEVVKPC